MNQEEIVFNELNVLDSTITYAEDQVGYTPNVGDMNHGTEASLIKISHNQKAAYQEYLIHAYGKAIRIKSELKGEVIFRLSQSAAIFSSELFQVATPASSIGRLVSIARVGQEYESKVLGEYTIIDVWEFDRYRGPDVVFQRRNFSSMTAKGTIMFSLNNLRKWLNERLDIKRTEEQKERQAHIENKDRKPKSLQEDYQRKAEDQISINQQVIIKAERESKFEIIEDLEALEDFEELKEDSSLSFMPPIEFIKTEINERELDLDPASELPEPQSIGLNAWFYVNLNEKQYDAAHIGKKGLAIVEGVAGSGKTSVALSRTKSLSQLSQLHITDENYTPDFHPEAQIGIVRTGELIQYLKNTCQELELHNFPVKEYSDIRDTLRHKWNLPGSDEFEHLLGLNYMPDDETRIEWADFVSDRMAASIRNGILSGLEKIKTHPNNLVSASLDYSFSLIKERFSSKTYSDYSKLYGLTANLSQLFNKILVELFDETVWLIWQDENTERWLRVPDENPIPFIIKSPRPYCVPGINQLHPVILIIPEFGLSECKSWLPNKGSLVNKKGEPVSRFSLWTAIKKRDFSNIMWKSPVTNPVLDFEPFVLLEIQVLNEKSIIELINNNYLDINSTSIRLAIFEECKVIKLRKESGQYEKALFYNRKIPYRFFDMKAIKDGFQKEKEEQELNKLPSDKNMKEKKKFRNKQRAEFREQFIGVFSELLKSPVKLYRDAILEIDKGLKSVPNNHLEQTQKRLKNSQLADIDIDLILLLTMQMLRGAGEASIIKNSSLFEPNYYAAVFIDEVQDFTEIQVRLMSMLADPRYRAVTVVGDMGQRLHSPSVSKLSSCFMPEHLQGAHHVQLTENIRQSRMPALNWLSSSYRSCFIDHSPFVPLPEDKQGVQIQRLDVLSQPKALLPILQDIPKTWTSVVVWPDQESAESAADSLRDKLAQEFMRTQFSEHLDLSKRFIVHQTIPKNIKGLEFDCLIVVGVERYDLNNVIAINELYVCLSRPIQQLVILGQLDEVDQRFAQLISYFDPP